MKHSRGFTLVEILLALVIFSLLTAGTITFLSANKRVTLQEEIATHVQSNLRIALTRISDTLRNGGYGTPASNLDTWIPWVAGFVSSSVVITQGTGTDPDEISIAACNSQPNLVLSADAMAGSTTINVDTTVEVNTTDRALLSIDESEHALVTSVGTGQLDIDTDSAALGNQGLSASYPAGTSLCRINIVSFDIDSANNKMRRNDHHGDGYQRMLDGIEDLQIQELIPGVQYQVAVTARSDTLDPVTGSYPARTMTATVTLKN